MAQSETQEVAININHVKMALRNDPEFFIQFFLGEQLSEEVPAFHVDVFASMVNPNENRIAIAIPRAHAKTTLCKLAAVWHFLFSQMRFILYVSGSHDLVVPYVNDIAGYFETHNFRATFGDVKWMKRSDGEGIYKFQLAGLGGKVCILRGLGSGQRTRGLNVDNERPELAICDDLEDDDDVATESQHKKMLDWWVGPFLKCLNKFRNKIIMSGNLLSSNSVFYKMLHSPLWSTYLYAVLKKDGTPLWPAMWPLSHIIEDYIEYHRLGKTAKWYAEMMNHPVPEGGLLIDIDKICYRPQRTPEEIQYSFVTVDPALSTNDWADNCAIAAHSFVRTEQQWQITESWEDKGVNPATIYHMATTMAARWNTNLIGVESGAMQSALKFAFELIAVMRGEQGKWRFVAVGNGNRAKAARIASWASLLVPSETGHPAIYALNEGEFTIVNKLILYDPAKKENDDDLLDACAQGVLMQEQYMHEIMQVMPTFVNAAPQSLYSIAQC